MSEVDKVLVQSLITEVSRKSDRNWNKYGEEVQKEVRTTLHGGKLGQGWCSASRSYCCNLPDAAADPG
jgi:hypothetical protein